MLLGNASDLENTGIPRGMGTVVHKDLSLQKLRGMKNVFQSLIGRDFPVLLPPASQAPPTQPSFRTPPRQVSDGEPADHGTLSPGTMATSEYISSI
ncbi:hypothetical protein STEG23_013998, partial [Scotinomys teguina]